MPSKDGPQRTLRRSRAVKSRLSKRSPLDYLLNVKHGMNDEHKPGEILSKVLSEMAGHERPLFLAHLEAKYRAAGDLPMLREIKAYKALMDRPPTSTPPPASA
jgi:hypothetical protein